MTIAMAEPDTYRLLQVDPSAHPNVITAAYRSLARLLHPDHAASHDTTTMAQVNRAYAVLRDPEQRKRYDAERLARAQVPAPSPRPVVAAPEPMRQAPPRPATAGETTLAYGRYEGWSLAQLARHNPDYLRWLSRHTSGLRYRAEIARLLSAAPGLPGASRRSA